MKLSKTTLAFLAVSLTLALSLTANAQSWGRGRDDDHHEKVDEQQVKLLGTLTVPGNPLASTDIVWADDPTGLVVLSDRSNSSVDVINGRADLFVASVTTNKVATITTNMASAAPGTVHFQGLPSNHGYEGPNGEVITPDKKGWAGDGDSTVKVIDLDPTSPTYLSIIAVINTAGFGCVGGVAPTGTCYRADEIAYDAKDNVIVVANDEPGSTTADGTSQPFLTFISAQAPYPVLGQVNFAAQGAVPAGGLEQPVWDPATGDFLQTLPITNAGTGSGSIVVYKLRASPFAVTIKKTISVGQFNECSPSGEALAPNGHLLMACKSTGVPSTFPLVIDLANGNEIGAGINQVGGGDEVNYNAGENEFIVSANVDGVSTNPLVLGVINADSGDWIQNAPTAGLATSGGAGNLAALAKNKHVFVIVKPAASPATDICGSFVTATTPTVTMKDYGCVAVFGPTGPGEKESSDNGNRDDHRDDGGFGFRF